MRATTTFTHDVFISHASTDKAVANTVCQALEEQGLRCWIAPRDIAPGQNFAGSIVDAIPRCRVFVLVLSRASNASAHVAREVGLAVHPESDLPVIPFRIEAVTPTGDLRFYLKRIQWLDALTPPLKQHLAVLVERVKLLVRTEPAPVLAAEKPKRSSRVRYVIAGAAMAVCALAAVITYPYLQKWAEAWRGSSAIATSPANTVGKGRDAVTPGKRLTAETLPMFLEALGLSPEAGSNAGLPCFINVRVKGTPFPVAVTLSKSQDVVWVFAQSPPMDAELTGEFALRLLQTNHTSGPSYFSYSRKGKRLGLRLGLTNGGITPAYFRSQLGVFSRMLNQTSAVWIPEK